MVMVLLNVIFFILFIKCFFFNFATRGGYLETLFLKVSSRYRLGLGLGLGLRPLRLESRSRHLISVSKSSKHQNYCSHYYDKNWLLLYARLNWRFCNFIRRLAPQTLTSV